MHLSKNTLFDIVDRTRLEFSLRQDEVTVDAVVKKSLAVLLAAVAFWFVGKLIGGIGIYALGSGFSDIFEPLEFVGLTVGVVIGIGSNVDNLLSTAGTVFYYSTLSLLTCGIGILLGWAIFALYAY